MLSSPLGRSLIGELNRLGILVDLSHTADETARQALRLTKAPVIWSHSSSRAVWNHQRNVPDDILQMLGESKGKVDGVVMVSALLSAILFDLLDAAGQLCTPVCWCRWKCDGRRRRRSRRAYRGCCGEETVSILNSSVRGGA